MNKFKRWIDQYQLTSFFFLTYLITWPLLLLFLLSGNEQAFGILVLISIFSPAFVNILISRIVNPVSDNNTRQQRRVTFWMTWISATIIFTFNVKTTSGIESPIAIVFFAIVALLPAYVLRSVFSKYSEVRKSLSSLIRPKGHLGWYLFALFIIPTIRIVSVLITRIIDIEVINTPDHTGNIFQLVGLIVVSFFYGLVFTGGLNEETGWTGFALPRLQSRLSPFISSIILWFFWIGWHMPMQIAGYWNSDLNSFVRALIGTFFARFIFTWLFNKTKGGILPAILLHASANTCFAFLPVTHVHMILEAVLAMVIIIWGRMWERYPSENQVVMNENLD